MRKLALAEWAALAEVIGTIAVVVSLLFVAYSINRNTAAIHAASSNTLFERHMDLANQFTQDVSLAELMVRIRKGELPLNETDAVRWEKYQFNLLDIWAMAYNRYEHDLLDADQWQAWDDYFAHVFSSGAEKLNRGEWDELKYGFDDAFWRHVEAAIF